MSDQKEQLHRLGTNGASVISLEPTLRWIVNHDIEHVPSIQMFVPNQPPYNVNKDYDAVSAEPLKVAVVLQQIVGTDNDGEPIWETIPLVDTSCEDD